VQDLSVPEPANIGLGQGQYGDGGAVHGRQLDLVGIPARISMHDRADITFSQPTLRQIPIEDHHVELGDRAFFVHRVISPDTL
jgi:hypothetical protein